MLSGLGLVAEAAHNPNCTCRKQIDDQQFLASIGSTCCAFAQSMSYFASALTPRPASIKSMQSNPTTQSSLLEGSTPGENSEEEGEEEGGHDNDTRATSITEPEAKPRARSSSSANPRSKTTFRLAHPPPSAYTDSICRYAQKSYYSCNESQRLFARSRYSKCFPPSYSLQSLQDGFRVPSRARLD